jgi:hypothetical protein
MSLYERDCVIYLLPLWSAVGSLGRTFSVDFRVYYICVCYSSVHFTIYYDSFVGRESIR